MGLARALGPDWDAVNATHLGLLRDAVERARRRLSSGPRATRCSRRSRRPAPAVAAAIDGQRALARRALAGRAPTCASGWASTPARRISPATTTAASRSTGRRGSRPSATAARSSSRRPRRALVESSLPAGVRLRDLGRHALKDIPAPEQLFQLDVPGCRSAFPPLRAGPGRRREPARSADHVRRARGGARRARGAARRPPAGHAHRAGRDRQDEPGHRARPLASGHVRDGAWFVPLDDVTDPGMVTSVIARTLGLFDGVDRPAADALPSFLADRSLLLLLDNFEHLLDAAGEVATLVRVSPGSRIVVTSRAPLHIGGEQEYPVRPLATGAAARTSRTTSMRRRASSSIGRERSGPTGSPARTCRSSSRSARCSTGCRSGSSSPRPGCRCSRRLPSATGWPPACPCPGSGPRDAPARQRTLEGAIDWSHDLLSPAEQATLHALAVFEGGFDVAQAEPVIAGTDAAAGDALDRLLALGEHSLIARDQAPIGDAGRLAGSGIRFGMLRTVQAYAARRLEADGREAEVRRRHALAYLDLAETAARHLFAAGQPPWIDRLTLDQPNLRAALRWAIDARRDGPGPCGWSRRPGASGRSPDDSPRARNGPRPRLSMPGADQPTSSRVWALAAAGGIAYWRSERERSRQHYREQLALAERLGDPVATADASFNLASTSWVRGDHEESKRASRRGATPVRRARRRPRGQPGRLVERDAPDGCPRPRCHGRGDRARSWSGPSRSTTRRTSSSPAEPSPGDTSCSGT